ncbi:hypothetical protein CAPTEDRAFT_222953 [Capitella teleta]|uniref:Nardilysin n=1 Tax=Capitella teleta TaxID=283909 RepID=X2ATT1_CAPTE|nr:hypothetical protein CAPTEDRAFT_222953 [Capitella teleta]|eukprot:ELU04683.1 hypothetical protein CAPTEDRAFT_222953 [Capitella teleta]
MSQEFERVIDPNEIRNSNCKMTKQSGPFSIVMTTVQKSPNDKREYRVLKLDNGLTALLISDPASPAKASDERCTSEKEEEDEDDDEEEEDEGGTSEEDSEGSDEESDEEGGGDKEKNKKSDSEKLSAAALCVGAGSFSDPSDIPGLSHFLEHMVFMGSEKYPDENDFDAFLKKHGGSSNAYTDCERTVFYFDVKREFFPAALDRFSQFFIHPLLKESSVDREIEAVDSGTQFLLAVFQIVMFWVLFILEFAQALPSDPCRIEQLLCDTAEEGHPMKKFMWGNTQSLKTTPLEQGINVYERLREHHKQMYSAHYMTLALQSREPLDDMQEMVVDIFSGVVKNEVTQPSFVHLKTPFKTDAFYKLYKVVPVKKMHKLILTWSLPNQLALYKSKPLCYIDWLIGHEGKGSILSYLKKRVWALELVAGNSDTGVEHNSTHAQFQISVSLTEAGMDNIQDVMTCIFEYLLMLKKIGPQERIYNEIKTIEDNSFAWKEQNDPIDYVDTMCVNMQRYPPDELITGDVLLTEYNPKAISNCLSYVTPDTVNIMFVSNRFSDVCQEKETWFQTPYSVEDIPAEWIKHWQATDFSIAQTEGNEVPKYPELITDNKTSKLWYKKDDKFNVPKAYAYFTIRNRRFNESAKTATICDLYVTILLHNLSEVAYAANVAMLSYKVRVHESSLIIKCYGFNHKLSKLFQSIVDHIAKFSVEEELFLAMKKEVQKAYHNCYIKPGELVGELRMSVLQHDYWSMVDRQNALGEITRKDILNFSVNTLADGCFVEGIVMGNISLKEAKGFESYLLQHLSVKPAEVVPLVVTEIPVGEAVLRVDGFNPQDENSIIVNYYQHGPANLHQYSLHNLLMMNMEEPCFDILRTREQLGYEVYNTVRNTSGILAYMIVVKGQAKKHTLNSLDEKIENFLVEFSEMIEKMTQEDFEIQVSSLITLKQCEDTHMKEQVDRNWGEVHGQTYSFNVLEREVVELKSVTLEEFKAWSRDHLGKSSQKKLSIQVQGNPDAASLRDADDTDAGIYALKEKPSLVYLTPGNNYVKDIAEFKNTQPKYPPSKII